MLLPALQTGEKVYIVKEAEAVEDAVATKVRASNSFMTGLLVRRAGGVRTNPFQSWLSLDIEGNLVPCSRDFKETHDLVVTRGMVPGLETMA